MAAAAAVTGQFTDVRTLLGKWRDSNGPFVTHRGRLAVLDWTDVNTDLIIPARYLKRIERTGFGPLLFADNATRPAEPPTIDDPEAHGPNAAGLPLNDPSPKGRASLWSAATSAAARAANTPSGPSSRPATGPSSPRARVRDSLTSSRQRLQQRIAGLSSSPRPIGKTSPRPAATPRRGRDHDRPPAPRRSRSIRAETARRTPSRIPLPGPRVATPAACSRASTRSPRPSPTSPRSIRHEQSRPPGSSRNSRQSGGLSPKVAAGIAATYTPTERIAMTIKDLKKREGPAAVSPASSSTRRTAGNSRSAIRTPSPGREDFMTVAYMSPTGDWEMIDISLATSIKVPAPAQPRARATATEIRLRVGSALRHLRQEGNRPWRPRPKPTPARTAAARGPTRPRPIVTLIS